MRVQGPVGGDLPFEAKPLSVGRQQEFDRCGRKADAVVEALHTVFGIDALDGHQDLYFGDARGVAGEQRLDVKRPLVLDFREGVESLPKRLTTPFPLAGLNCVDKVRDRA